MPTLFSRQSLFSELRVLLLLAMPILANGILQSSTNFFNTFLIATIGENTLAAAALGGTLFMSLMVVTWGTLQGASIVIAHYHGAENKPAIRGVFRDSLILSVITAIPIMILLWFGPELFLWSGQSRAVVEESRHYLHALVCAAPFDLAVCAVMQLFQGISKPRINLIFGFMNIPLLIFLNYAFVFGKFSLPHLGLAGLAWSLVVVFALFLVISLSFTYFSPFYRDYANIKTASTTRYFKEILTIGLPMGVMYGFEIAYLLALAIFFGKINQSVLSAHQITMQYFWLTMMLAFCFDQAFSIRAGWRLGRREMEWIKPITLLSVVIITVCMLIVGLAYWFFPHILVKVDFLLADKPSTSLLNIATLLFIYIAFYQLTESIRLTLFSILRALKDTQFALWVSIVIFWGIALPLGYYLSFIRYPGHPEGLWVGGIVSSIIHCGILIVRLQHKIKKGVD